jgi:hypothetical protein
MNLLFKSVTPDDSRECAGDDAASTQQLPRNYNLAACASASQSALWPAAAAAAAKIISIGSVGF